MAAMKSMKQKMYHFVCGGQLSRGRALPSPASRRTVANPACCRVHEVATELHQRHKAAVIDVFRPSMVYGW
jgi:hypothetical protein